jgi:hypothetical protein
VSLHWDAAHSFVIGTAGEAGAATEAVPAAPQQV